MLLEFSSLEIENFKCFVAPQRIVFNKLPDGLHAIQGRNEDETRLASNGAGKSSMLGALCWCLFGRTAEELRNPDIQPWKGGKTSRVSATLFLGDAKHVVERTANPNALKLDGAACDQAAIDGLLGLDIDTFLHTVLLSQGQPLFFDLSASEKLSLFSTVLQLDRWETRAQAANEQAKALNQKLTVLTTSRAERETSLKRTTARLEEIKQLCNDWAEEQRLRREAAQEKIKEHEDTLRKITPKLDAALLQLDSAGTEDTALAGEIEQLRAKQRELQREVAEHETEQRILKSDHARLQAELKDLGSGSNCPTCGQSLEGTDLAKHQRALKRKIAELAEQLAVGLPAELLKRIDKVTKQLENAEAANEKFRARAEAAQVDVRRYQPQVSEIKGKLTGLKDRLLELEREENPHRHQLEGLRKERAQLTTQLEALDADIAETQSGEALTRFWVKGFKDVRLYIIGEVVRELEAATNAMLAEVGLDGWEVKYAIEKETKAGTIQRGLNVSILSPRNKHAVKWNSWSGGEAQRLRIVGALALSEVLLGYAGLQTTLIALDEPASYLSLQGIQELCNFLADYATRYHKQVLYIDHQAVATRNFASNILITKTQKGSKISVNS